MDESPVRRTGQSWRTVVSDELKERVLNSRYPTRSWTSISRQAVIDDMRRVEAIDIVQVASASGMEARHTSRESPDFLDLFGRVDGAATRRRTEAHFAQLEATWQRITDTTDTTAHSGSYRLQSRESHFVSHHMATSRGACLVQRMRVAMSDFFINAIDGAQYISDAITHRNRDVIRSAIGSDNGAVASVVAIQSHIAEIMGMLRDNLDEPALSPSASC